MGLHKEAMMAGAQQGGGGMWNLLLPLLSSMAPGLLNKMFGGDPQKDYRDRVNNLLSPQNMGNLTNQYFQQAVGGPGYSQGQQMIAAGANQAGNQVAQNLGARGIGTSGTGAILSGLVPSLVGSQMAGLRTNAYEGAQGQAKNNIQEQIAALSNQMAPSQTSQMFSGGLAALGPFLQKYLEQMAKNKMPGGGGGPTGEWTRGAADQYPGRPVPPMLPVPRG